MRIVARMIDKDIQINITEIFVKIFFKVTVTSHFNYQYNCIILNSVFQN